MKQFLLDLNANKKEGFEMNKDIFDKSASPYDDMVFVGYDTRDSSERLIQAVIEGVTLMNGKARNYNLVTTP